MVMFVIWTLPFLLPYYGTPRFSHCSDVVGTFLPPFASPDSPKQTILLVWTYRSWHFSTPFPPLVWTYGYYFCATASSFAFLTIIFLAPIYGCGALVSIMHSNNFNCLSFVLIRKGCRPILLVNIMIFFSFKMWHLCYKCLLTK